MNHFVDENVFLDVPPEFELFTNIKKIFVKEFIDDKPEKDIDWRVENAGIYNENGDLMFIANFSKGDRIISLNKVDKLEEVNVFKITKINKCRPMGRTDFIVFFIIVSTLLLGLPVIVLLFLPNFCVHELALEDTNKKKMILTNKLGFVRPRFLWSRNYLIQDENLETLIKFEGPYLWDFSCCPGERIFRIYDKVKEIGLVTVEGTREHNLEITFPINLPNKTKALIMTSAFLWSGFRQERSEF